MKSVILKLCWATFMLCSLSTIGQEAVGQKFRDILSDILYNRFEKARSKLDNQKESIKKEELLWHFQNAYNKFSDSVEAEIRINEEPFLFVLKQIRNGKVKRNRLGKNNPEIITNFNNAYQKAKSSGDNLLLRFTLHNFIAHLYENNEDQILIRPYIVELAELSNNDQDLAFSKFYETLLDSEVNNLDNSSELIKILELLKGKGNYLLQAKVLQMIGVFKSYYKKDNQLAIRYWEAAASNFERINGHVGDAGLFGIYNNIAIAYSNTGDMKSAFQFYYMAKPKIESDDYLSISYFYQGLAEAHKKVKNLDSVFYYLDAEKEFLKKHYNQKTDNQIRDLLIKNQTSEKEKQILIEKQRAMKNRNWLIAASLALFLGAGIAILLQKNTTKKRQLAEQEVVLKQQRVENLLKEQELVSIDAMIAGQEKERQKVAGELHDDLGSLMATIKLHFDNSKVNKNDPGLQNVHRLLEEAYQKVRSMAHSKNSGVMSDQGLLPAIKKMAKVISQTNALQVLVEDFGMGDRLDNSLELNLFRMVQELVANAIKHADASKVNIQLTQHEDNLNIIIEDNGKGFDRSELKKTQSGMGLTSIEKRVEHLDGNFTIDSIVGKGTSIIIDIPV